MVVVAVTPPWGRIGPVKTLKFRDPAACAGSYG